uniref:60S ribosomal protein L6 n=1 Tax=Strongyloides venezuelensis TaxID=75913 RepID=A0A0K0G502_STRVS
MITAHFTLKQDVLMLKALLSIQHNLHQKQKIPKTPYKVGELVLVRGRNPKLSNFNFLYKGPFKVTQVSHLKVYYISLLEKRKLHTVRTASYIRVIPKDEVSNNITYCYLEMKPCQSTMAQKLNNLMSLIKLHLYKI